MSFAASFETKEDLRLRVAEYFNKIGLVHAFKRSDGSRLVAFLRGDVDRRTVLSASKSSVSKKWEVKTRDSIRTSSADGSGSKTFSWIPFTAKQLAPVIEPHIRVDLKYKTKHIKVELEPYIVTRFLKIVASGHGFLEDYS